MNQRKRLHVLIVLAVIVVSSITWWILVRRHSQASHIPTESTQPHAATQQEISSETTSKNFNKEQYSITSPDSIWVVVNKQRPLPAGYKPNDLVVPDVTLRLDRSHEQMQLRKPAADALKKLFDAANNEGVKLRFSSGYRSEALQKSFYDSYVTQSGREAADTFSARPKHSEHQTGLAADISNMSGACHLETCFSETPEGKWLTQNAFKHGFIVRYPEDKAAVTGYQYEPWHLRFVGNELAAITTKKNTTLEEFFNLPEAPNY